VNVAYLFANCMVSGEFERIEPEDPGVIQDTDDVSAMADGVSADRRTGRQSLPRRGHITVFEFERK